MITQRDVELMLALPEKVRPHSWIDVGVRLLQRAQQRASLGQEPYPDEEAETLKWLLMAE